MELIGDSADADFFQTRKWESQPGALFTFSLRMNRFCFGVFFRGMRRSLQRSRWRSIVGLKVQQRGHKGRLERHQIYGRQRTCACVQRMSQAIRLRIPPGKAHRQGILRRMLDSCATRKEGREGGRKGEQKAF
jgi:hypothetical protein